MDQIFHFQAEFIFYAYLTVLAIIFYGYYKRKTVDLPTSIFLFLTLTAALRYAQQSEFDENGNSSFTLFSMVVLISIFFVISKKLKNIYRYATLLGILWSILAIYYVFDFPVYQTFEVPLYHTIIVLLLVIPLIGLVFLSFFSTEMSGMIEMSVILFSLTITFPIAYIIERWKLNLNKDSDIEDTDKKILSKHIDMGLLILLLILGSLFAKVMLYDPLMSTIALKTSNADNCLKIVNPELKKQCIIDLALYKEDLSICYNINTTDCYKQCSYYHDWSECVRTVLKSKLSYDFCLKHEKSYARDDCLSSLGIENLTLEECELFTDPSRDRDVCLRVYGIKLNDSTLCSTIYWHDEMSFCLGYIAANTNNRTICDSIDDKRVKNDCYEIMSKKYNSLEYCDAMSNSTTKNACYSRLGIHFNNITICETIPDDFYKSVCYFDIAEKTGNATLCEFITHRIGYKTGCKRAVCETVHKNRKDFNKCIIDIVKTTGRNGVCTEIRKPKALYEECMSYGR